MNTLNRSIWFTPYFSSILQERALDGALVSAGAIQIGLHLAGLPGWVCPFKAVTGIPCPGCGLTTATGELLQGQFGQSLQTHAFAVFFLLAFFIMTLVLFLPAKPRQALIAFLENFERRSGFLPLFLTILLAYWVVRLAGFL